jgi:surface antigen
MALRPVAPFGPLIALALSALVAGCATAPGGGLSSSSANVALPMAPVMSGAVSGGLIGGTVGNGLAPADRQRAYEAELAALETGGPGYPIGWKGEDGARGTVIAGPAYVRPGYKSCRDYSHTIYIDNRPQIARGAACLTEAGVWTSVVTS